MEHPDPEELHHFGEPRFGGFALFGNYEVENSESGAAESLRDKP
jgi:hypothetical protein